MAYRGELIGEHPSILEVGRLIAKVAASPVRTVLIYGETGTGKGLVARMLHERSARARGEFVDVNCAAIPASLLESELFGHERGAFTGAAAKKTGLIEVADRGTLFLDEIREMDLVLQAKLLTLLDSQCFRRLGSTRQIEVDVRFIAATNKVLLSEVKRGTFREDLYYRLQVVSINMPPLRGRGDDVLLLADYFLRLFNGRYGRRIRSLEPAVVELFRRYPWPGNVRELEHLLERIFALEDDDQVLMRHIPARILREVEAGPPRQEPRQEPCPQPPTPTERHAADGAPEPAAGPAFHQATAAFQRRLIEDALARARGNLSGAAAALGLSRHALRHQMGKLGLLRDQPASGDHASPRGAHAAVPCRPGEPAAPGSRVNY